MASIEDKILGGPRENYCSSDEGEDEADTNDDSSTNKSDTPKSKSKGKSGLKLDANPVASGIPPAQGSKWGGYSVNTGPKGVLRDWELYQEAEAQLRIAKEHELIQMVKDSSITCRTEAEDAQAQKVVDQITEELGSSEDLDELLMSDKVLEQFVKQRMDLMIRNQAQQGTPIFLKTLVDLKNGEEFLQIIDNSSPTISILIHIYDDKLAECVRLNEALESLSGSHTSCVQFCKIKADAAGVSAAFKAKGIPALLCYKGGNLIGNFVQLKEELGTEFFEGDVENFLIERGIIQDRNDIPALIAAAKKRLKDQ